MSKAAHGVVTAFGLLFGGATSAYTYYLKAPSVAAVRPELTEVGFWTALFSGRFVEWLFLTEPMVATALLMVFWVLFWNVALFTADI